MSIIRLIHIKIDPSETETAERIWKTKCASLMISQKGCISEKLLRANAKVKTNIRGLAKVDHHRRGVNKLAEHDRGLHRGFNHSRHYGYAKTHSKSVRAKVTSVQ